MSKMYILVNRDLEIDKGKLSGQVGHACLTYLYNKIEDGNIEYSFYNKFKEYMEDNQKKIILSATPKQLNKLEEDSKEKGLGYITIRDMGYTDLEPNTLTCMCVGIEGIDMLPAIVKKLRLYKG